MSSESPETSRFVIVAALDASEAAHEIVRVAANFARGVAGGELHLVHVVEDLPSPASLVPPPLGLGISSTELLAGARKRVEALAAEARGQFAGRLSTHVAAGSAWKQILQVAVDVQADLLVVGTHGRGGVKRMLLGSVAETVVRKASCPVLVVREKDYHAFVPPEIEPACSDCVAVQQRTGGAQLWCERHAQRHPHARLHYEVPESFGLGSQLFRDQRG
jgi:nucleotide-binding universal stress UspA family protein